MRPTKYVIIKRDDLKRFIGYLEYEMISAQVKKEEYEEKAHNVWKDSPRGASIRFINAQRKLHYKLKNIWLRCEMSYRKELRKMEAVEKKKFFGIF